MKKLILLFFFFTIAPITWSQLGILEESKSIDFKENIGNWTIDNLGNLIVQQGNTLVKIDTTGKQVFTQSIKSLGEISQIATINSMKVVLFSEEQQCICLLDNTLSINGKCKYLEEFGLRNAKFIATSNRPNLIWIFDQFNSTIFLVDIITDKIIQKVENFAGLAGIKSEITSMEEYNNKLYLQDASTIFEFDQMLSWSNSFTKQANSNAFWRNYIVGFDNNSLIYTSIAINEIEKKELGFSDSYNQLKVNGNDFYFSGDKKITKFKVKTK
jgi:hypothetical protein